MYLGSWFEVIVHGGRDVTGRLMQLVTLHLNPRSQEAEDDEHLCSSVFSWLVQSGTQAQPLVFRVGLSSLVFLIKMTPHRPGRRLT